jgi:hypothetical protein
MRSVGTWRVGVCLCACLALGVVGGCGGRKTEASGPGDGLTFENLPDTAGLSAGRPIVESFGVERLGNRAMQVHGRINFPDGTRIQVAVKRPGERSAVAMVQMTVQDRRFDSPPILGDAGPLPVATYRFELSTHFSPDWQSPAVLRATNDGRALRGPGITRTGANGAMFWLVEEMTR